MYSDSVYGKALATGEGRDLARPGWVGEKERAMTGIRSPLFETVLSTAIPVAT